CRCELIADTLKAAPTRTATPCADANLVLRPKHRGVARPTARSSTVALWTSAGRTARSCKAAPEAPQSLDDGSAAAILSKAESLINAIATDVVSDLEKSKGKKFGRKHKKKRKK
ncbi:MAG: hypothetical protein ACKO2Q_02980, partial [Actinomycetota bacterium]